MTITARQLAMAVNGCGRISSSSLPEYTGMHTWAVDIMNQYCHIVDRTYHTGWYQEEAEQVARERCSALHEFTWQVIQVK